MNFTSIPVIVICCYMVGEVYKVLFKNNKNVYKLIPILVGAVGGVLGVLIHLTTPKLMNVDNYWTALGLGIVSGFSTTGTNQIVKQLLRKEEENV